MMPPPHLHLRPDDRVEAGAGHLSRCLSLGIAWRRHGTVSADVDPGRTPWAERYSTAGIELGASPRPPDWLVVDERRPPELAEKARLLDERHDEVFAALESAVGRPLR